MNFLNYSTHVFPLEENIRRVPLGLAVRGAGCYVSAQAGESNVPELQPPWSLRVSLLSSAMRLGTF